MKNYGESDRAVCACRAAEADGPVPAERTHGRAGWSTRVRVARAVSRLGGGSPRLQGPALTPDGGASSQRLPSGLLPTPRRLVRSPDSPAPQLRPQKARPTCPRVLSLRSHTAAPRPKFGSRRLPAWARHRRVLTDRRASGGLPPCSPPRRRSGEASTTSPRGGAQRRLPSKRSSSGSCPLPFRLVTF